MSGTLTERVGGSKVSHASTTNFSKKQKYIVIAGLALIALSAIGLYFGICPFASSAIFSLKPMMVYSLVFAGAMTLVQIIRAIFRRYTFPNDRTLMMKEIIVGIASAALLGMFAGVILHNGLSLVFWIVRSVYVLISNCGITIKATIISSLVFGLIYLKSYKL